MEEEGRWGWRCKGTPEPAFPCTRAGDQEQPARFRAMETEGKRNCLGLPGATPRPAEESTHLGRAKPHPTQRTDETKSFS